MKNAAQDLERLIREIVRDELHNSRGGGRQPFSNNRPPRPKNRQKFQKFGKPRRDSSRDRRRDDKGEERTVFGKAMNTPPQKPAAKPISSSPKAPDRKLDNSISGAKNLLARLKH